MKIGFFTEGFPPGADGVSTSSYETAKELERRGHEVYIVAPKYPGYVDKNPRVTRIASVKIHQHPEIRMGVNITDKGLRKTILNEFDIIHGHSGGPITFIGREVAREKKIPFIFTYHTLWNRYTHYFMQGKVVRPKTMEQISKIFGNIVDCVIAPTEGVEKELKKYGVKKPIVVIPSGLPIEEFKSAAPGFLRKKINNEHDPILLFVGRLGKEKSPDFLIRMFKKVLLSVPNTQLVLIGDGVDRKKLEALAKKLKVDTNTHFLGAIPREDMHKIYKDASLFVFASTTETQGLVVPEALSSGVPVIAVDDPAYECVVNGKNGYLVRKDEGEFAKKVVEVLQDRDLARKLSEGAVEGANQFSLSSSVDKLEDVYFNALDKHNIESVPRIMGENSRAEKIYTTSVIFWLTIVLLRAYGLLFYKSPDYPTLRFQETVFYGWEMGVIFLLIFLALFLHRRSVSFMALLFAGVGTALVANEAASVFLGTTSAASYWNVANAIPIFAVGITGALLARTNIGERPKFYISTRIQKHVNPANPKISVVIPAYNEAEFIEPTLKSLLNQTYKNFELIVVDNNSSDNTSEVAEKFGARVIKQTIKGVAAARNKGFSEAHGEIIASTDADSVVPDDWVARIAAAYEKDKSLVGFAGLNALYSGAVSARAAGRYLFPIFWRIDKWFSHGWNMAGFNMSARKSAFLKIGGFDTTLKMGEDIDLSRKLRQVGKIGVDENLIVASSGRRYSEGLFEGMASYAPWWISTVLLKQDKPFEFSDVRSEKSPPSRFSFLIPTAYTMLVVAIIFLAANALLRT